MYTTKEHFLQTVKQIIREALKKGEIHPEEIALKMSMSPSTFRRRINLVTGDTPLRLIQSIRLEQALELLENYPFISIGEVASQCGFSDNSHFTKVFKRIKGLTPMQYIINQRKSRQ